MNKSETLRAAEIMRRAAEGEIVEFRFKSRGNWDSATSPIWNWMEKEYRILEFPEPPKGESYHNPHNLNATQVGVHEGFRLLLKSELDEEWHTGTEFKNDGAEWRYSRGNKSNHCKTSTLRTKAPLPEKRLPSTQEEASLAYMESKGFNELTDQERDAVHFGWNACQAHHWPVVNKGKVEEYMEDRELQHKERS